MVSSFFIQIIVLAACFQKTGGFALYWPLGHFKLDDIGRLSHTNTVQFTCEWLPLGYNLYATGHQLHPFCDWQPHWYNLFATCHQMHIISLLSGKLFKPYLQKLSSQSAIAQILCLTSSRHGSKPMKLNSYHSTRQFFQFFCMHAAITIIWIKKCRSQLKI